MTHYGPPRLWWQAMALTFVGKLQQIKYVHHNWGQSPELLFPRWRRVTWSEPTPPSPSTQSGLWREILTPLVLYHKAQLFAWWVPFFSFTRISVGLTCFFPSRLKPGQEKVRCLRARLRKIARWPIVGAAQNTYVDPHKFSLHVILSMIPSQVMRKVEYQGSTRVVVKCNNDREYAIPQVELRCSSNQLGIFSPLDSPGSTMCCGHCVNSSTESSPYWQSK